MSDEGNDSVGQERGPLPSLATCADARRRSTPRPGSGRRHLAGGDGVRVDAPGDSDAEDGGGLSQVVVHLGEQPVEGVEGEHGADARHEGHGDALAVQVQVRPAQDVGFDGALFSVELGIRAHGDSGGEELGGLGAGHGSHDPAGVHAVGGDDAFDVLGQVRGREPEGASALKSVADGAADAVEVAEDAGGTGDVAGCQELAHPGGGPAAPLGGLDVGDGDDAETVAAPQLAQRVNRARVAAPEAEVFADDDLARAAALHQVLVDEFLGLEAVDAGVVVRDEGGVQPRGGHRVQAVAQRGDQLEAHLGLVYLDGVRVEGDGHGVDAELAGALDAGGDDLLVSVVHAVEVADGDDTGLVAGNVGEGIPDVHCLSFSKNQDGAQARAVDAQQAEDLTGRGHGCDGWGLLLGRGLRGVASLGRPLRELCA